MIVAFVNDQQVALAKWALYRQAPCVEGSGKWFYEALDWLGECEWNDEAGTVTVDATGRWALCQETAFACRLEAVRNGADPERRRWYSRTADIFDLLGSAAAPSRREELSA